MNIIFPTAKNYFPPRIRFLCVALPVLCAALLFPSEYWMVDLLRHFRIWCGVLAVLLFLAVLLLRLGWKFGVVSMATAIWQLWPLGSTPLSSQSWPPSLRADAATLKLLSYNLLYRAKDRTIGAEALYASGADVMALQEYSPEWADLLHSRLTGHPHRLEDAKPGASGLAVFSRIPLTSARRVRDAAGVTCLEVVVDVAGQSVGLLVVHPAPPVGSEKHTRWREGINSYPVMLKAIPAEHQLLAGDLNATPFCIPFQRLLGDADLRDSATGFPLENTWHWHKIVPLGLPIDHLLISGRVSVASREIGPALGSDHRWILAKLQFHAAK